MTNTTEKVFYTSAEVMSLLRIKGKTTLYRMVKRGDIPKPRKISHSIRLWNKKEFDEFLGLTDKGEAA